MLKARMKGGVKQDGAATLLSLMVKRLRDKQKRYPSVGDLEDLE